MWLLVRKSINTCRAESIRESDSAWTIHLLRDLSAQQMDWLASIMSKFFMNHCVMLLKMFLFKWFFITQKYNTLDYEVWTPKCATPFLSGGPPGSGLPAASPPSQNWRLKRQIDHRLATHIHPAALPAQIADVGQTEGRSHVKLLLKGVAVVGAASLLTVLSVQC